MREKSNSFDFLKQVVDYAPLGELKKVIWSTHYDQGLNFGAVLVEIVDKRLQKLSGGIYSLEVWSGGTLLYQRPLKQRPRAWCASRYKNSIVFVLHQDDEEE